MNLINGIRYDVGVGSTSLLYSRSTELLLIFPTKIVCLDNIVSTRTPLATVTSCWICHVHKLSLLLLHKLQTWSLSDDINNSVADVK